MSSPMEVSQDKETSKSKIPEFLITHKHCPHVLKKNIIKNPNCTDPGKETPLYDVLFEGNEKFVEEKMKENPNYFKDLASGQHPKYMLIGCADSRVHPDKITGTEPGEMFIHRNVANLVVNTDLNCMSVVQYAVEVLEIKHLIVMGHYGCGGIKASLTHQSHGLIDQWLRNIKDVYRLHTTELNAITDPEEKFRRMVELNVKEQVLNLCKTPIVQKAWSQGKDLFIHGWVFDIETGVINDLEITVDAWEKIKDIYELNF